jgi:predicted transcriptional regulator
MKGGRMPTLGREMKKARAGLGLKQKDLQEITGISQKYLSRIENDKADPGWSLVRRIADALQLDLQAFVVKSEHPGANVSPPTREGCRDDA